MKILHLLIFIIAIFCSIFVEYTFAQDQKLKIIIVAGQSNAVNLHCDISFLESSDVDTSIQYYYNVGINSLPPLTLSTSNNKWTKLEYHTQTLDNRFFENFFGPEMTLARNLYLSIPNLAVIKCAYSGSNIALDWEKGIGTGSQLYELMLSQVNSATNLLKQKGIEYEFVGFFWMQGESDASNINYANDYQSNLSDFISNVRSDLNNPSLNFVLGRIGVNLPSPYIYKYVVRTAQVNISHTVPNVSWVDTDDLSLTQDKVHFLADGIKILGNRMADAWKAISTNIQEDNLDGNTQYFLLQNYPNPFNPTTTISYQLKNNSFTQLKVFDMLGREIATLVNKHQTAGRYSVEFNASHLANGVYIYQLSSGAFVNTKKLLLVN